MSRRTWTKKGAQSPWNPSVSRRKEEGGEELFIEDPNSNSLMLVLSAAAGGLPLCYLHHPRKCLPTEIL